MKHTIAKFAIALLLVSVLSASFGAQPAYAAGIIVNSDQDTVANDGQCTLREAITNANADNQSGSTDCTAGSGTDTITFAGDYTITIGSTFDTIVSQIVIDGTGRSITIDGNNAHRPFLINGVGNLTITNLTIVNSYVAIDNNANGYGGAILNLGTLTVNSSTFSNNTAAGMAGSGGAISNMYGTTTVSNSIFTNNTTHPTSGGGGAIHNELGGTVTITDSVFTNNQGSNGGALYLRGGTATLTRVLLANNSAGTTGGAIYSYENNNTLTNVTISGNSAGANGGGIGAYNNSLEMTNVTLTDNYSQYGGALYVFNVASTTVVNSILWGNTSDNNDPNLLHTITTPTITYSIVQGGYTGTGNLDQDPLLTPLQDNEGDSDTHALRAGSPAIDAGTNTGCPADDQRGFSRPFDGDEDSAATCDIGAVETKRIAVLTIETPFANYDGAPQSVNILHSVSGTVSNIRYNGSDTEPSEIGTYAITADFLPTDTVNYETLNSHYIGNFTIGACHVDDSASGANDGTSWTDAYTDLQSALNNPLCEEIWVAAGVYRPDASDRSISFQLSTEAVYGGFAGTETQRSQRNPAAQLTILSGEIGDSGIRTDNSYHVVNASAAFSGAVLDGFIIEDGYASDGDSNSSLDEDNGGGIFLNNGSPTLRNLHIRNNLAEYGGGISAFGGSAILENVTFNSNTAIAGGGLSLLNSANYTLRNVTFFGNTASDRGGAMHIQTSSDPSLFSVTIAGNSASVAGGAISLDDNSDPTLLNVIVWGNTAPSSAAVHISDPGTSEPGIAYSVVQGGFSGVANRSTNPMLGSLGMYGGFTPTIPVTFGSSAINTGSNIGCPTHDQRGVSRLADAGCDIGAYEAQNTTTRSSGAQDGWILESSETSNQGGTLNKNASTLNVGDDAANRQYRAVLSFNTAGLPDNAIVLKATLRIRRQGITGGGNPIATFGGFMVDVRKGNFGTSALQLADFQTKGNKTIGALKPKVASGGWYTLNLTGAKTQINKTGNTQIRLRFKLDDNNNAIANFLKIYSGNAPMGSRPQLIVDYYTP